MIKVLEDNKGIPASLLWILAVISAVSVANIYYAQPLLDQMNAELNVSQFAINLMPMTTQMGYAAGLLFIVPLGDLYSRRRIILIDFLLLAVTLLAVSATHSLPVLLALSFVTGMCSVIPQVFIPMASQYSRPEHKSRNIGILLSGLLTGILASRVVSGVIGEYFGWRTMYVIAAAMMLASIFVVWRFLPSMTTNFRGTYTALMRSLGTIFKEHPLMKWSAMRAGCCFGGFLGMWASLVFKMSSMGYGNDTIGLLGVCGIAGALTASSVGAFIRRYGSRRFHLLGASLMLAAWVLMIIFQNYLAGFIVGIVVLDIGMQCVQLSNQTFVLAQVPNASSRANTIFMTLYFIGGALGTFLSGVGWHYGQWYGVAFFAMFLIALSLVITWLKRI